MTPPRPAVLARYLGLAAVALGAGGCSLFFEPEAVPFRSVAQGASSQPFAAPFAARTVEDEAALRDAIGVAAFEAVDYETSTVLALGTLGGCPSASFRLAVTEVVARNGGVVVSAEVTAADAGDGTVVYPYDVIAIDDLEQYASGDEVRITTSVEGSGFCRF